MSAGTRNRRFLRERIWREFRRIFFKAWLSIRRMVTAPTYKARLIFRTRAPGILNWETASHEWLLPGDRKAVLYARHVATLAEATEFHAEIGGFASPEQAREVGEKLRGALRLANAILGVGLNVPALTQEVRRAQLAPHVKEKIAREHGASIVDCVFGLNVLRDGEEYEMAVSGGISAKPKHSEYVLDAASRLWGIDENFDEQSRLVCELLNGASRDPSPRSAFLVSFLALDLMLERRDRPEEAQHVLKSLRKVVEDSSLAPADKARLSSFLGSWQRTSLGAEIDHFVSLGSNATTNVQGEPLGDFLKRCLKIRHKLAHPSKDGSAQTITEGEFMTRCHGLRQVVMAVVWARNKLPAFSVERPGDVVQVSEMKISIL
jgi:hypothetical protein